METSKLDKLDEKIKQLQAQKKSLIAREKEKERKARTRRLIQIGAIFDSMGFDTIEKATTCKEEFEKNLTLRSWLQAFKNKTTK